MIVLKIDFKCKLCGNCDDFYVMPIDEKVGKDDYISSLNRYRLQCKKCKKDYILSFNIEMA